MASLGLEGVNRVLLVSLESTLAFGITPTLNNTIIQFNSSLATRTFLCTFTKFFSGQNNPLLSCISLNTLCILVRGITNHPLKYQQPSMWSIGKGKVLMSLLSLVDGTPQIRVASWVAKRDDNHGEETKDKAASYAGKQERHPEQHGLCLWYGLRRDQERSRQERLPIEVFVSTKVGLIKKNSSGL